MKEKTKNFIYFIVTYKIDFEKYLRKLFDHALSNVNYKKILCFILLGIFNDIH